MALEAKEKEMPLVKRTPVRSSVTELLMLDSSMNSARPLPPGLYMISVMARNSWYGEGWPG